MIELREHSGKARDAHPHPPTASATSTASSTSGTSTSASASTEHSHAHSHGHSHGILGHSHSHGEDDHGMGLVESLSSGGDRGARITVIGLAANVVLTTAKGLAGWFMNSAALLAEAGHSLSDLLGDIVVLASWRLSRRPPSVRYPHGLAKFETCGTAAVALLLLSGGLGIGVHSVQLLLLALAETAQALPAGALQTTLSNATSIAHVLPAGAHAHPVLDPNAAWFAAASVGAKEWLFRATRAVAAQEGSPVLMANAYHHRSDAYSSAVALVAILGSTMFPALPLDPIGGVVVSAVIIRQGVQIFAGTFNEFTDASAPAPTLRALERALDPLAHTHVQSSAHAQLLGVDRLRARRAGSQLFVDLAARVRPETQAAALAQLESAIADALKAARKDVKEVAVRFVPVAQATQPLQPSQAPQPLQLPPPPHSPASPSASAEGQPLAEAHAREVPAPPSRPVSPETSQSARQAAG